MQTEYALTLFWSDLFMARNNSNDFKWLKLNRFELQTINKQANMFIPPQVLLFKKNGVDAMT